MNIDISLTLIIRNRRPHSFSLIIFYYVVATTNFSVREKWEDKKLAGPMKNFSVFFHLFLYNMRKSAI